MEEATTVITAPTEGTTPEVMPDSPIAKVDDTPDIPSNDQPSTENSQPEIEPQGPSEMDIYQDVTAKHAADPSYDMTDVEAEAFLNIDEKIMSGAIKKPEPKKIENKEENKEENKQEPQPVETDSETVPQEENPVEPESDALSMSDGDSIQKTMDAVGAKNISEIPEKVDGLVRKMKESGGTLGTELKAANGTISGLQGQMKNHQAWMDDLAAGKPAALEFLQKVMGNQKVPASKAVEPVATTDFLNPEDYVDNELAPKVIEQNNTIKVLIEKVEKLEGSNTRRDTEAAQTAESAADQRARASYADDIVDLITKDTAKVYNLTAAEARKLATDYWNPENKGKAIHPRFQKIHELVTFAYKKGYPNIADADILFQHKNGDFAKKLIAATKDGEKTSQHIVAPNGAISSKQGKNKQSIPQPTIDNDSVEHMKKGQGFKDIPDEWMDASGMLIPSKVPKRHHVAAFGRVIN